MISRREILKDLLVAPFAAKAARSESLATLTKAETLDIGASNLIVPRALTKGSKIAITAPASPSSTWEVNGLVSKFRALGVECEIGETVKQRNSSTRYLSAPDDRRLDELMGYFLRDDIDGIFCARGGYGVIRILEKLDYAEIARHPKILVGYSDITALLFALYSQCGLVCYHGPVASSQFDEFTTMHMLKVLFSGYSDGIIEYTAPNLEIISPGTATGQLVGGNLTMVSGMLGTPYDVDTAGKIIFLEETREEPYKIDRMLTQMILAGKFKNAAGVILGNFEYLKGNRNFFPGRSFSTMQVLVDRLGGLGIPVMFGIPFGHMKNKMTLPLGVNARIDTAKKSFSIIERAIC